jgi:hypothetical protein
MDRLLFRHMVLPQPQKKIVFLAGTPRRHSFPWKIVWSETSFYIRPRLANEYEGPSWHLSFHGPSAERKPPGFRIRWDDARKVPEGLGRVFRDLITERAGRKGWWTGQDVADGVRHAVRIRAPADVFFVPGPQPWAPAAEDLDLTALNISAPIPSGRASDLDLYVVEPGRPPWWPNVQAGRRDNSIIGSLVNPEAGQAVTGQVRHHGNATHPTPERLLEPFVGVQDRRVRGITIGQEDDVLWLVEQWGKI